MWPPGRQPECPGLSQTVHRVPTWGQIRPPRPRPAFWLAGSARVQVCGAAGQGGLEGRLLPEARGIVPLRRARWGPAPPVLPQPLPTTGHRAAEAGLPGASPPPGPGGPPAGSLAPLAAVLGPGPGARHAHVGTCGPPRAGRVLISPLSWEFLLKTKQTKKVVVLPGSRPLPSGYRPASGASGSGGTLTPLGCPRRRVGPLPGVQAPGHSPWSRRGWPGSAPRTLRSQCRESPVRGAFRSPPAASFLMGGLRAALRSKPDTDLGRLRGCGRRVWAEAPRKAGPTERAAPTGTMWLSPLPLGREEGPPGAGHKPAPSPSLRRERTRGRRAGRVGKALPSLPGAESCCPSQPRPARGLPAGCRALPRAGAAGRSDPIGL